MKIIAIRDIVEKVMGVTHSWNKGKILDVSNGPDDPGCPSAGNHYYEDGKFNLIVGIGCVVDIEGFEPYNPPIED